jgi:hypothetical protein
VPGALKLQQNLAENIAIFTWLLIGYHQSNDTNGGFWLASMRALANTRHSPVILTQRMVTCTGMLMVQTA